MCVCAHVCVCVWCVRTRTLVCMCVHGHLHTQAGVCTHRLGTSGCLHGRLYRKAPIDREEASYYMKHELRETSDITYSVLLQPHLWGCWLGVNQRLVQEGKCFMKFSPELVL